MDTVVSNIIKYMMNRMRGAAVPIFILMSFYLMEKAFLITKKLIIIKRP